MKKEVAKKWVKALRSGKYKQGQSYLKKFNDKGEPRHCCLGVLCELYNDTMKKNRKKTLSTQISSKTSTEPNYVTFNGSDCSLPIEVRRWADIKDGLGLFNAETETECLADLNDRGKKFKTIADIIEKNIENI
jgi:hypothetical protein